MTDAQYNPLAGKLTVPEAALALGVSERTLWRLIYDGKLAALPHGRRAWIERNEIDDYFARQRAEASKLREQRAKAKRSGNRPRPVKVLAG